MFFILQHAGYFYHCAPPRRSNGSRGCGPQGQTKRDAMYNELLISGSPRGLLFDTFFLEEIERLRRLAPAVLVYPFVMTGNRIVRIYVARISRFREYSGFLDLMRLFGKILGRRLARRYGLERIGMTMIRFPVPWRFQGVLQGTVGNQAFGRICSTKGRWGEREPRF